MKNLFMLKSIRGHSQLLILIVSVFLTACAGMATKAQIKLSLEEIQWQSDGQTFDQHSKIALAKWLSAFPLRDIRLKINKRHADYSKLNRFLLQQGLTLQQIEGFSPNTKLPTDNIFIAGIVVRRSIPQCPSWQVPNMADSQVRQSSNYGCASQRNLAIMVADPSDLVRGKKLAPASSEHSINAMDRYYRRNVEQAEPETPAEPLTPPTISGQ